jgi:putative chitinase
LLARIFPPLGVRRAETFVDALNLYLARYEIDSVARMSAFFGQVSVESAQMTALVESMNYTAERIVTIFRRATAEDAKRVAPSAQATASYLYANINGNGNEASGDGWSFRGRGLMHLTGRGNYEKFSKTAGVDVVSSPELLESPTYAVWTACWYWGGQHQSRLNRLADAMDIEMIGKVINGGSNGRDQRLAETSRIRKSLTHEVQRLGAR